MKNILILLLCSILMFNSRVYAEAGVTYIERSEAVTNNSSACKLESDQLGLYRSQIQTAKNEIADLRYQNNATGANTALNAVIYGTLIYFTAKTPHALAQNLVNATLLTTDLATSTANISMRSEMIDSYENLIATLETNIASNELAIQNGQCILQDQNIVHEEGSLAAILQLQKQLMHANEELEHAIQNGSAMGNITVTGTVLLTLVGSYTLFGKGPFLSTIRSGKKTLTFATDQLLVKQAPAILGTGIKLTDTGYLALTTGEAKAMITEITNLSQRLQHEVNSIQLRINIRNRIKN